MSAELTLTSNTSEVDGTSQSSSVISGTAATDLNTTRRKKETRMLTTNENDHQKALSLSPPAGSSVPATVLQSPDGFRDEDEKKKNDSAKKTRKWFKLPTVKLPSLPILKILQGVFLILMIGQNLPGAEKSFWPFNKQSNGASTTTTTDVPLTPYYLDMRSDLYGHERQFPKEIVDENGDPFSLWRLVFGKPNPPPVTTIPLNTGVPTDQRITLTHLNRDYETYRYSVASAVSSKVMASREYAQMSFRRALERVLARLTDPKDKNRLAVLEEQFLEQAGEVVDELASLRASLVITTTNNLDNKCSVIVNATDSAESTLVFTLRQAVAAKPHLLKEQCDTHLCNTTNNSCTIENANTTISDSLLSAVLAINDMHTSIKNNATLATIAAKKQALSKLTVAFLQQIPETLPPGVGAAIRDALQGHAGVWMLENLVQDLRTTPMRTLFRSSYSRRKKRLFVLHFVGDLLATGVSSLREEVTAIVRSSNAGKRRQDDNDDGDEVLVILQSGGGTVTGYGLVAGQLLRLQSAGLKLTVAVEQVAASGGYMAAVVADTIFCSPFALVGSLGVVQEMPNVYERLQREGVEFHQITAGPYKRILSPTKAVTTADLEKAQRDIEDVWTLFKEFVHEQRPTLDMDVVGTGEVWFGKRAVEVGLCDSIRSADDVLSDYVDRGYDVYQVKYKEPVPDYLAKFLDIGKVSAAVMNRLMHDVGITGNSLLSWKRINIPQIWDEVKDTILANRDDDNTKVGNEGITKIQLEDTGFWKHYLMV